MFPYVDWRALLDYAHDFGASPFQVGNLNC